MRERKRERRVKVEKRKDEREDGRDGEVRVRKNIERGRGEGKMRELGN